VTFGVFQAQGGAWSQVWCTKQNQLQRLQAPYGRYRNEFNNF